MKSKFTKFTNDTNWVKGITTDESNNVYSWEAKIFDDPSSFGINEGRVSKLFIVRCNDNAAIVNYDRGWDVEPETKTNNDILNSVLRLCESSAKRFE